MRNLKRRAVPLLFAAVIALGVASTAPAVASAKEHPEYVVPGTGGCTKGIPSKILVVYDVVVYTPDGQVVTASSPPVERPSCYIVE
jgi:hypothetical protein